MWIATLVTWYISTFHLVFRDKHVVYLYNDEEHSYEDVRHSFKY